MTEPAAPTVHRPALLVHAFLAADHATRPGSPAAAALARLWQAAGSLGMDEAHGRWPADPPATGGVRYTERLSVIAARRQDVPGAFHRALMYRLHDAVGVTVLRAPNDDAVTWTDLDREWRDAIGEEPVDPVLGTATIYLGLWADASVHGSAAGAVRFARGLAPLVPPATGPAADWSGSWCRPGPELLVWELPTCDATAVPRHRRLLAMAAEPDEDLLDQWVWSGDTPGLTPLTNYLLHAAKLRYSAATVDGQLGRLRRAVADVEAQCAELTALLAAEPSSVDRLLRADRTLSALRTGETGLAASLGAVKDMARTVTVAETNMAAALGRAATCGPGGPVEGDRLVGQWARGQLEVEQTYLESAHMRAAEVSRVTAAVVDRGLAQRQESLTLFQTSLLGALVMVLTGVQSLNYDLGLPGSLLAPTICVLGALALLLPSAVLRWSRAGTADGSWRWLDTVFAGLFGAAAGWFAVTVAVHAARGSAAWPVWSVLAALAGAGILGGLAVWRRGGGRQQAAR
jgi:hypothetical protein